MQKCIISRYVPSRNDLLWSQGMSICIYAYMLDAFVVRVLNNLWCCAADR